MRACEAYAQMHKTSEKYSISITAIPLSPKTEMIDAGPLPGTQLATEDGSFVS
jgi:hypothetical protein